MKKPYKTLLVILVLAVVLAFVFARPSNQYPPPAGSGINPTTSAPEGNTQSASTLAGKKWTWVRTQMNNDTVVTPNKQGLFGLTFDPQGTVGISTDCNSMSAQYKVEGSTLTIGDIASTMMFCENSQETEFSRTLPEVASYMLKDGQLVLMLKNDSGSMIFN